MVMGALLVPQYSVANSLCRKVEAELERAKRNLEEKRATKVATAAASTKLEKKVSTLFPVLYKGRNIAAICEFSLRLGRHVFAGFGNWEQECLK